MIGKLDQCESRDSERTNVGTAPEYSLHYSRKDVAAILGVTRQRVHQLILNNLIDEHDHGLPPEGLAILIEARLLREATEQYKPPLHISISEAAKLLGKPSSTVRVGIHRGLIPALKIGGRVWIPERYVEEELKGDPLRRLSTAQRLRRESTDA